MFEDMANEVFTLVNSEGKIVKEKIRGNISRNTIFTHDKTLPITINDRFLRMLPSGLSEEYIVVDPGFHSGFGGIKAHYQTKVKRSDAPPAQPSTIINNLHGANARVNIHSTDNSTNQNISVEAGAIFTELRRLLAESPIPNVDARIIEDAIYQMQSNVGKPSFKEKYTAFMSTASDHMGVFAPILGALASLL